MAVGIVAAAAFCHDSMTSRRGTEVPGFSPGRAATAQNGNIWLNFTITPRPGGALSVVNRCSLYTTYRSLNGRWMKLNLIFVLICRRSRLYWTSASRNMFVVKE